MNRPLTLLGEDAPSVALRAVEIADIEQLRLWKNANKNAFFFKEDISPAAQERWFEGYLKRPADFMFIVESRAMKAGCMGFRVIENAADCYNIIGAPEARGRGIMREAMILMCSYIRAEHSSRIGCAVIRGNSAVSWYEKCGYRIASTEKDFYRLELDFSRFSTIPYKKMDRASA